MQEYTERLSMRVDKMIVLVIEGEGCVASLDVFLSAHGRREKNTLRFLFFCYDWYRTRGYTAKIMPQEGLNWHQLLVAKLCIWIMERSRALDGY